jgi:hypothetical protein
MNRSVRMAWIVLVAGALAGCASQRDVAIHATPTSDEFPNLTYVEPTIPVRIAVEGRTYAVRSLVPDFEPPELTDEERAILADGEPEFEFLPYATRLPLNRPVGPWYGGVTTGVAIDGRLRTGRLAVSPVAMAGQRDGIVTAINPFDLGVTSHLYHQDAVRSGYVGPASTVTVGELWRTRIADRYPYFDY